MAHAAAGRHRSATTRSFGTITPGSGLAALSATQFRDVFGTRVFPTYTGKVYGELVLAEVTSPTEAQKTRQATARKWLTDLNPGFITHVLKPGMDDSISKFTAAMSNTYGIKSVLTVGEPFREYTDAQWSTMMGYLTGTMAGHVAMVAGQNEVNHVRDSEVNKTVTRKAKASGVVTITVSGSLPGSLELGHGIKVAIGDTAFDGTYRIKTFTSGSTSSTVTYSKTGSDVDAVDASGTATLPVLPPDWAQQAADYQKRLWDEITTATTGVNAKLVAAGLPKILVGNACLWSGNPTTHNNDLKTMGPLLKNYCDATVWHLYPRGTDPNWGLDGTPVGVQFFADYKTQFGNRPVWCTEAGYLTAPKYVGGAQNNSEAGAAIYLKKMVLEYALRRVNGTAPDVRVGQFELLDDPDPTDADREKNLGIIEVGGGTDGLNVSSAHWTAKQPYTALKGMLTALSGGVAGNVDITITGSGILYVIVKHATGTRVWLWRRGQIEKDLLPVDLSPASVTATIVTAAGVTHTKAVGRDVEFVDI